MFKELRRRDRKLNHEDVTALLEGSEYGVLSTVNADGYPYGIPLSYTYYNNVIYFHCALEGHKLENITNNNKVSFCVVGETEPIPEKFSMKYQSVILFGRATEVNGEEKQRVLLALVEKYSSQHIEQGKIYIKNDQHRTKVFKIDIEHISGKTRK